MDGQYEKITLANGLRVFLEQDSTLRSAAICLYVCSGSRHETRGQQGAAHYLEHILFRGTENHSGEEIEQLIDRFGGTINAQTSREYITIEGRVLSSHAADALELICDMVCRPTILEKDVESERGVILEEIAMCADDSDEVIWDMMYENVWKGSQIAKKITGERKAVEKMTAQTLRDYISKRFVPKNIMVSVVGCFDRDAIMNVIESSLGKMPKAGSRRAKKAEYTPSFDALQWTLEQNHVLLAFPGYAMSDERRLAQRLLEEICGEGYSSRLYRRLRDELGLIYDEGCSGTVHEYEGLFTVEFSCSEKNCDMALGETAKVLYSIAENGVTEDELTLARDKLTAAAVMSEERSEVRAFGYLSDEMWYHAPVSLDKYLERLNDVTVEQVNEAARDMIKFDNASVFVVGEVKDENHYRAIIEDACLGAVTNG